MRNHTYFLYFPKNTRNLFIDKEFFEGYHGDITRTQINKLRIMRIGKQRTELKPHGRCRLYFH